MKKDFSDRKITQKEYAWILGTTQANISRILAGTRPISNPIKMLMQFSTKQLNAARTKARLK